MFFLDKLPKYNLKADCLLLKKRKIKPKHQVYFALSMIVYFLNIINPNHSFVTRFKDLLERYHLIDVRAMGFPENWENEGIWDEKKQGNGSL